MEPGRGSRRDAAPGRRASHGRRHRGRPRSRRRRRRRRQRGHQHRRLDITLTNRCCLQAASHARRLGGIGRAEAGAPHANALLSERGDTGRRNGADWRMGRTRAQVVHPKAATRDGWIPFLMQDDLYEAHEMLRSSTRALVVCSGRTTRSAFASSPAPGRGRTRVRSSAVCSSRPSWCSHTPRSERRPALALRYTWALYMSKTTS